MVDRARDRQARRVDFTPEERDVLTAASQMLTGSGREQYAITYKSWQDELWAYTKSVGEYGSVLNWYASGISRMHLRAGIWKPGLREPEIINEGLPATLVNELVTFAKGGETQFLKQWARHLFVPGVGVFLAEETPEGDKSFTVKSLDVVKRSAKKAKDPVTGRDVELYDIRIAPDRWRTTTQNALVARIFDPDPQYDYLPTSMSANALTALREIDLYNRHIVATLLSRIAFNGFLLIPSQVTFPVNPQFKDAPDPFIAELLHIAQRGIKDPGSPGSAIPVPLRVPAEWIESFKHLIVASGIDPKVIEARESAIKRLSEQLPAPPEALSGIQDMNHWNAWKSSEDAVKMYFGPTMEILTGGLTDQYLHPMMRAAGVSTRAPEGGMYVVWYDSTDLTIQPDNSENANAAFDKGRIGSDVYLDALGFDPADAPKPDKKWREQVLMKLAMAGTPIPDSFYLLFPEDKPDPAQMAEVANAQQGLAPGQTPGEGENAAAGPSANSASPGTPDKKRPSASEEKP